MKGTLLLMVANYLTKAYYLRELVPQNEIIIVLLTENCGTLQIHQMVVLITVVNMDLLALGGFVYKTRLIVRMQIMTLLKPV